MENNRTIVIESDSERRTQLVHLLHASGFTVTVAADLASVLLDTLRGPRGEEGERRPTLAEIERRYACEVLRATGGNKTRAAEILGIDRKTLYRLIGAARSAGAAATATATEPEPEPLRRANGG